MHSTSFWLILPRLFAEWKSAPIVVAVLSFLAQPKLDSFTIFLQRRRVPEMCRRGLGLIHVDSKSSFDDRCLFGVNVPLKLPGTSS